MSEAVQKKWDDSLISMGLGALVVVVSGILLFNYFNNQAPKFNKVTITQSSATASLSANTKAGTDSAMASVQPTTTAVAVAAKVTSAPKVTAKPTNAPTMIAQASIKPTTAPVATQAPTLNTAQNSSSQSTGELVAKHTVVAGESLWSISEKYYGTGYEWKKLVEANKIASPSVIEKGTIVEVPRLQMISAASTEKPSTAVAPSAQPTTVVAQASTSTQSQPAAQSTPSSSTQIAYTVATGDSLWSIAQTKCGDGYAWSKIASENKLVSPGIIHTGNQLNFTCK
jgi:nucleoid-associated protein YgaU